MVETPAIGHDRLRLLWRYAKREELQFEWNKRVALDYNVEMDLETQMCYMTDILKARETEGNRVLVMQSDFGAYVLRHIPDLRQIHIKSKRVSEYMFECIEGLPERLQKEEQRVTRALFELSVFVHVSMTDASDLKRNAKVLFWTGLTPGDVDGVAIDGWYG